MIQQVKELAAKLNTNSFGEFRSLVDAEVNVVCAGTIKVTTAQHVLRKWTKVGDAGDRIDIRAVKTGAEVKVIESVRGAAGVRPAGTGFRMRGCLDRAHASRERIRAIKKRKWEATADRDDGGDRPSVQKCLSRASHVPRERNVPGAREYAPVTEVEIRVALVNLGIEGIQESEICVVVGLAKGRADIVNDVGIRIARMQT